MTAWGTPAAATPPGWYTDPQQPMNLRWWDGTAWTEHSAPGWQPPTAAYGPGVYGPGAYGPGPAAPNQELTWLLPVNRDGFAIASGYLGLFSFIPNPFTAIPAIVCGCVALQRIAKSKKLGTGRAWFGIVVGGLSLAVFVLAVAFGN